jgi:two-component system chemotaxis sensor kinase CheA
LRPDSQQAKAAKRLILVVDDSLTTRSMVKNILQAADYNVIAAVDGEEAWARLQASEGIELVVSDVDMPNLDGFELTAKIRQSDRFQHLPVILVTSRDSAADLARGAEVGANRYLVKSGFHQSNILDEIRQLLFSEV